MTNMNKIQKEKKEIMSFKNKLLRVTLYCYIPIIVIFAIIRMLSAFGLLNFLNNFYGDIVLNLFIQVGLLFIMSIFLFAGFLKAKPKSVVKFFGFKKITLKQILITVLIGIVVYILNVLITTFFNSFLAALGYQFTSSGSAMTSYPFWLLIVNLFITAVLPGVCEEVAHRGMLLKGFSPLGAKKAILFSALLFGLLHLNIEQFFYATLIGMLVGYTALRCESIVPAMIIHFMNNAMSVFMGYSSFHGLGLDKGFYILQSWLTNSPVLGLIFMLLLITSLFYLLIFLLKRLFKSTTLSRMNRMQRAMIEHFEREKFLQEVNNITNGDMREVSDKVLQELFIENFDSIYLVLTKQIGWENEIESKLINDEKDFKLDKISKILLITTFVIVGVLTFFTFIWGVI